MYLGNPTSVILDYSMTLVWGHRNVDLMIREINGPGGGCVVDILNDLFLEEDVTIGYTVSP
jgi:D-tyrosyl-tRNA(Tyr) deacylase